MCKDIKKTCGNNLLGTTRYTLTVWKRIYSRANENGASQGGSKSMGVEAGGVEMKNRWRRRAKSNHLLALTYR